MKNYIKLSVFALFLIASNLVSPAEPFRAEPLAEHINPERPFDSGENKEKIAAMLGEKHSEWIHKNDTEGLETKEDVKAPASDIEWGKHIFSGNNKLENLGKKLSGIGQRISDSFSDWWNGDRRGKVTNRFSEYSNSDDPNKKLFDNNPETKKAFLKLRPDIQLEYINDFVEKERNRFNNNVKTLKSDITKLQEKNDTIKKTLDKKIKKFKKTFKEAYPEKSNKEIDYIVDNGTPFKTFMDKLRNSENKDIINGKMSDLIKQHDEILKLIKEQEANKTKIKSSITTLYQNIHESYFTRLDNFRKDINQVLKENNPNLSLKYNLKTNLFEFHNPESTSTFLKKSEKTNPTDYSGIPQDKVAEAKHAQELDNALEKETEKASQEHARQKQMKEMQQKQAEKFYQERQKTQTQIEAEAQKELNDLAEQFKKGLMSRQKAEQEAKAVIEKAKEETSSNSSFFGTIDNSPFKVGTTSSSYPYNTHQDNSNSFGESRSNSGSKANTGLEALLTRFEQQVDLAPKPQTRNDTDQRGSTLGSSSSTTPTTKKPTATPQKTEVDTLREELQTKIRLLKEKYPVFNFSDEVKIIESNILSAKSLEILEQQKKSLDELEKEEKKEQNKLY